MKTLTIILLIMVVGLVSYGIGIYRGSLQPQPSIQEWSSYVEAYEIAFKSVNCKDFLMKLGEGDEEVFSGGQKIIKQDCVIQEVNKRK